MLACILTENDCYKAGERIVPKGIVVHSTGANNPALRRYVQPVEGDPDYSGLISALGKNLYGNDWNNPGISKCTHGFIGKLYDGTVEAVQTLPWDMRGWHAGSGRNGSANNTHIGFEICEDNLKDGQYFFAIWDKAVELTTMLCKEFNLDPLKDGVVISHNEAHDKYGIASNHGDPDHWFALFGKSMDSFRNEVAIMLDPPKPTPDVLYKVQVGAFRNLAYAEAMRDELREKGYSDAYIVEVEK